FAIEQNELIGLRSEQGDAADPEKAIAIDRSVLAVHPFDMTDRILEGSEGIADNWPAVLTGKVRERVALRLRARARRRAANDRHGHGLPPMRGLWSGTS